MTRRPNDDLGFFRALLIAIPVSLLLWYGLFLLWKRTFAWLGGVL